MQHAPEPPVTAERQLIEAIALRRLIRVSYNGAEISLAPHQLFERHGDLFLSAYNPGKNRRSDEVPSLGTFKLKGLGTIVLTDDSFEPLLDAGAGLPRTGDQLVFGV